MDVLNKVPVREQEPKVRATNFDEVCLGYNKDEAVYVRRRASVREDVSVASRVSRFPLEN